MTPEPDEKGTLRPLVWTSSRSPIQTAPPNLQELRLVACEEVDHTVLLREFPTIALTRGDASKPGDTVIDDFAWRGAFDLARFDEAVLAAPAAPIAVRGGDAVGVALEVLGRYQRLLCRRNAWSQGRAFEAVLSVLAALPSTPPFLKEDVDHALDTWQWVVRLDPAASLRTQLAALVHELDRVAGDSRERLEHRARGDSAKDSRTLLHAIQLLRDAGISHEEALAVRDIVAGHPDQERDSLLLDDADALSFLSLGSSRYADHFGHAQTRRKVAFTVGRLGDVARQRLALVRLRPDVARLLHGAAA
jgi:hypothetical protein